MEGIPGRLGSAISVSVKELSQQGLNLETSSALPPGRTYRLRLLESTAQDLEMKVIWCRLDRSESHRDGTSLAVYRAGLRRLAQIERVELG